MLSEIDLGFALAAASKASDQTFSLMKNVILAVVDKYGQSRVRYMAIVFGENATVSFSFADTFASDKSLKIFVSSLRKSNGLPDVEKALREARNVFYRNARSKAKKILVLLTDKDNAGNEEKSLIAAKGLEIDDIKVYIPSLNWTLE